MARGAPEDRRHHPHLTHGFIQMTRWSQACEDATRELAELIGQKLG